MYVEYFRHPDDGRLWKRPYLPCAFVIVNIRSQFFRGLKAAIRDLKHLEPPEKQQIYYYIPGMF